jgi:hypothetical protein
METEESSDYILIPNPLYDVVFRYLMEDIESAKIVLSTLLGQNIKSLTIEPTEKAQKKEQNPQVIDPKTSDDIRLFRLDFVATIELPDGKEEMIMIELQKASEADDIFRFKRYISKNFQKKQKKEVVDPKTFEVETIDYPIRLVPIFILNFRIEHEINDLLIKTSHLKTGIFKNTNLEKPNEFIDNLSYDLYIVQLPNISNIEKSDYLGDEYKTKLYSFLKLFDQHLTLENGHRLKVFKDTYPAYLERIIKRIQSAAQENEGLEEQMYAEDEYLKALIRRDNKIAIYEQMLEKNEKTIEAKDKLLEEKDKVIYNMAKLLKQAGISVMDIHKKTGISIEEIEEL